MVVENEMTVIAGTTPLLQPGGAGPASPKDGGELAELRRENEALRTASRQLAQRVDRLVQALGAVLDVLPRDAGCADTLQAVAAELENLRDGVGVGQLPLMPLAIPKPRP